METNIEEGKWKEFKGEMRNLWGDLTEDDLERTKGNIQAIGGLLKQKFGHTQDVKSKFDELVDRFNKSAADLSEQAKKAVRKDVHKH